MNNYLKFGELSNVDLGVYVTTPPNVPTPAERGESVTIPGRSGNLWIPEGAYDAIELSPIVFVPPRANLNAVRLWLTGEGLLWLDRTSNLHYKARVNGAVDFAPFTFGDGYQASIPFECDPFRYLDAYDEITVTQNGISIQNPYAVFSEPKITIWGSGDAEFTIGGTTFAIENIVNGMILDTELQEAYQGTTLYNERMEGAFPVLSPGFNVISWEGGTIARIVIDPRWRTL